MTNNTLAVTLATARKGTFTGLIIRKVGETRGGIQYGRDLVHTVIVTGFSYRNLVQRSLNQLNSMETPAPSGAGWVQVWTKSMTLGQMQGVCEGLGLAVTGKKADLQTRLEAAIPGGKALRDLTSSDMEEAMAALKADLQASLDGTAESTTDEVFEPLIVDGEYVRGARVYVGHADETLNVSPKGTIYLQGLAISSKVLEADPNGPVPGSKSAPSTVAKEIIRRMIPISRYVSYRLSPDSGFLLRAGGAAAAAATADGVYPENPARTKEVLDLLAA